jgi:hypothetical protein
MGAVAEQWSARSSERDKVLHRTRATTAGGSVMPMMLVDVSPGGFMARSEAAAACGDRLWLDVPVLGRLRAEVRWALGGRIGCRFEHPIPALHYGELLRALRRP